MSKEAIQRLREPAAWILVGAALASVVGGLAGLLFGTQRVLGVELTFALNASNVRAAFTGIPITALPVAGVLLATQVGERLPRARTLVMVALGTQGGAALFGVVCWLGGLVSPLAALGGRLQILLAGAGELAVLGIATFFTLTVFRSLPAPPKPPKPAAQQQAFPGFPGFPQQGAPGQPGYPGYPQQGAPQQYGEYAQPAGQQYGQPPAGPAGQAGYGEYGQHPGGQEYGQDYGAQSQPGGIPEFGAPGGAQGGAPGGPGTGAGVGAYAAPRDTDAQGGPATGAEGETDEAGMWTHAYGPGGSGGSGGPGGADTGSAGQGYSGDHGGQSYGGYAKDLDSERPPHHAPGAEWPRDSR